MLKWIRHRQEQGGRHRDRPAEAGMDRDKVSVGRSGAGQVRIFRHRGCQPDQGDYEAPTSEEAPRLRRKLPLPRRSWSKSGGARLGREEPLPRRPVAEGRRRNASTPFLTGLLAQGPRPDRHRMDENGTYRVELRWAGSWAA